jgi:hypothetical protein
LFIHDVDVVEPFFSFDSIIKMGEAPHHRGQKSSKQKRKVAHAEILTSSPYKRYLENSKANTSTIGKRKQSVSGKGAISIKKQRKETAKQTKTVKQASQKNNTKKATKIKAAKITQVTANDDSVPCLYCGDLYGESNEPWIQCQACLDWAHVGCAGANKNQTSYICERCT